MNSIPQQPRSVSWSSITAGLCTGGLAEVAKSRPELAIMFRGQIFLCIETFLLQYNYDLKL